MSFLLNDPGPSLRGEVHVYSRHACDSLCRGFQCFAVLYSSSISLPQRSISSPSMSSHRHPPRYELPNPLICLRILGRARPEAKLLRARHEGHHDPLIPLYPPPSTSSAFLDSSIPIFECPHLLLDRYRRRPVTAENANRLCVRANRDRVRMHRIYQMRAICVPKSFSRRCGCGSASLVCVYIAQSSRCHGVMAECEVVEISYNCGRTKSPC
jgi:hypothetical protein